MKFSALMLTLATLVLPTSISYATPAKSAITWLNQLSESIRSSNFSTSFVVVKNNHAEPYHWFHGVNENGEELEIVSLLNGPRRDILRRDSVVAYIEPELPAYSVSSSTLRGPIPSIFAGDVSSLAEHYDFVPVGKGRVLGRGAQIIRIEPQKPEKYAFWLWIDQQSGLLLKLAIVTKQGQQLEQVQFTHLDITPEPSESVLQLANTELPEILDIPENYQQQELSWQVNWVPDGFSKINANRHRIVSTKQPVEFQLFSDGLVEFSVYVGQSAEKQRPQDFVMDGATVAFNQVAKGFEVSVVGKIPVQTAKRIAESVGSITRANP